MSISSAIDLYWDDQLLLELTLLCLLSLETLVWFTFVRFIYATISVSLMQKASFFTTAYRHLNKAQTRLNEVVTSSKFSVITTLIIL